LLDSRFARAALACRKAGQSALRDLVGGCAGPGTQQGHAVIREVRTGLTADPSSMMKGLGVVSDDAIQKRWYLLNLISRASNRHSDCEGQRSAQRCAADPGSRLLHSREEREQ
jgi:hypothetical protein